MKRWKPFVPLILILMPLLHSSEVHAQFDPSAFGDPSSLLSDEITSAFIRTVGFGVDHHPMQPATPLGSSVGLDIFVELMLFHTPAYFNTALSNAGFGSDLPPSLPFGRVHLAKGFGNSTDIGMSLLWYTNYLVVGGDIKWALSVPEEGVTWAFRISYNHAVLDIVTAKTLTPQLVISRKLSFADPYLAVGVQYTWGSLSVPLDMVATPPDGVDISGQVASRSASAFSTLMTIGVGIKLGPSGLKLTLEGSYNLADCHHFGLGFGFTF